MVTDDLARLVRAAIEAAVADNALELDEIPEPFFERPKRRAHGDWSTNIALQLAQGGPARPIAEVLAERLERSDLISTVDVAGPGFLNFHLSPAWLHDVVRKAADETGMFGRASKPSGLKVNVEYVSANPTGPVNVVSGRHAAAGDAVANLLEAVGHEVTREFYINDAGRQIDLFAASLAARYLQQHDVEADVPEDGYQGEYLIDVAREIAAEVGDRYVEADERSRREALRELGLAKMLDSMKGSLARFGTSFDVWFSESALHAKGEVEAVLDRLRKDGWLREEDGAIWFLSSRLGDDKDRVVRRANGDTTYLASDLAYLVDKFARGSDLLIYLWGADHHGTIARLTAGVEALGFDLSSVEISLVQIVTLLRGGETVKASKRAGVLVPLDELVDEVGADAARYTFLSRSMDGPLDFDIELAKEQAPENPVYYVQYAHARISSIGRRAGEEGVGASFEMLERLEHPSEDALMRKLASYEEVVPDSARLRAPQRITRYAEELASDFSAFYRDCKVITDDPDLSSARLALCFATRSVLASALGLLGVRAPESM